MLTDNFLVKERSHPSGLGGVQRVYRFPTGFGLSAIDSPRMHHYPFAWEIAVLKDVSVDGAKHTITYDTPLTDDVEVFDTDEAANEFIHRAAQEIGR